MDNFDLKKFISGKTLLNESAPGYDTRKTGEALPTLESVKAAYEAKNNKKTIKEGVWEIGSKQGIQEFISKMKQLKNVYWNTVGSDSVMDGMDTAIGEAEELLKLAKDNKYEKEYMDSLNEVRGPLKIELSIKKGEAFDLDELMDDYGFEENVDEVPVEDLFDEEGKSLRDMSIVYDQRDDMYLMNTEDIEKYH
jgi:hypothetical protein